MNYLRYKKQSPPRYIFMDMSLHIFSTLLFCLLIYLKTHSLYYGFIVMMGGIFIDLDHLIDYHLFFRGKFSLNHFLNCFYLDSGKVYVLLHSWELVFLLLALSLSIKSFSLFLLFLSMSVHLLIDNMQRKNPLAYFLFYRFNKRFKLEIVFPELKNISCKKAYLAVEYPKVRKN